jgi:predicted enzyme related to lactoylglutathione lyase
MHISQDHGPLAGDAVVRLLNTALMLDAAADGARPARLVESKPSVRATAQARDVAPRSVAVHPATFSWHQLHAPDPCAAARSIARIIGADFETRDRGLFGMTSTVLCGGLHVAGADQTDDPDRIGWEPFVRVPDVDLVCDLALELGGSIDVAPAGILGLDRRATIADPTGARLTVIAGGDDRRTVGAGAFGWDELRSTDTQASLAFWSSLFGWTVARHPDRSPRRTLVLLNGGRPVAGISACGPSEPASRWLPVATVSPRAIAAALDHAADRGGIVVGAGLDHPVVGRCALVRLADGVEFLIGCDAAMALRAA